MDPWYKIVTPRKEVREGRSFNPDEFAIALEQVVAGTAPKDYTDPAQFFSRTFFSRALRDHSALVLRRLSGITQNTPAVLLLITQFGGGKTHTLTTLYHLANSGTAVTNCSGVPELLKDAGIAVVPKARVAVFVGNAWDPRDGRETPWIDIARQLAGDKGVAELGPLAMTTPPGTDALARVFAAANAPVLVLFDEVLNFLNRHRGMADSFYAFIQNLTVAMAGAPGAAAVISLPRSQVEMTDWDEQWQVKISKVVRRVAQDLIANDEAEISEVVRRRLFEDIGGDKVRKNIARAFGDWCFERRAQLPPEWTAVDTATTDSKARDFLQKRFEACYPFHPGTLSVFQRKWQALPQYQQTRGTLAMLAQWISIAYQDAFRVARTEALITLGSAPLSDPNFRSVVLGQLGESRLLAAIEADIAGEHSHAKALDADTKGPLRDIHRRVGTTILFESSGGQTDKVAHLPELRFDLGEPQIDTTSIDTAAATLEDRGYFIRKVGSDGFRIGYQPRITKVVNDRRASLDEKTEVIPALKKIVEDEFRLAASVPVEPFPTDGSAISDLPRLTLVIADPSLEWSESGTTRAQISDWTRVRGDSARLYPAALVWCVKKPGRDLRDRVESLLAWKRVKKEVDTGTLEGEFDKNERAELQADVKEAEGLAKEAVWGDYRFAVLADSKGQDGLKVIDLGAGHSSSGETLCGRVLRALTSDALLNESVGAGYLERNWPPALKESGAWPLASLRQSFLNGSLTRLLDPDTVLRSKIAEFVKGGDFGFASGLAPDGTYERIWFEEALQLDEITFDNDVFLLREEIAKALRDGHTAASVLVHVSENAGDSSNAHSTTTAAAETTETTNTQSNEAESRRVRLSGEIPPELWNRLGSRIIPKMRSGSGLILGLDFSVLLSPDSAGRLAAELYQALQDLGLSEALEVETTEDGPDAGGT